MQTIHRVESHARDGNSEEKLSLRRKAIQEIDEEGIIATPANSSFNELVVEAGRASILNDGKDVEIIYGEESAVKFRS